MKKLLILTIAMIALTYVQAQKKMASVKVPAAAKAAFMKAYPNATGKWEKEDGNYEVTFQDGGKTMSCIISAAGDITETETEMTAAELPATVTTYIAQHYKGAKAKGAATIVKKDGTTLYEAVIKGKDVMFDSNGTIIQSKKEKD